MFELTVIDQCLHTDKLFEFVIYKIDGGDQEVGLCRNCSFLVSL